MGWSPVMKHIFNQFQFAKHHRVFNNQGTNPHSSLEAILCYRKKLICMSSEKNNGKRMKKKKRLLQPEIRFFTPTHKKPLKQNKKHQIQNLQKIQVPQDTPLPSVSRKYSKKKCLINFVLNSHKVFNSFIKSFHI